MSALTAVREAADFVVHHPARTALRLVGAAKGTAKVLTGETRATVVPPNEPMSPPIPAPTPEPLPGPDPVQPPEPQPDPQPGGQISGQVDVVLAADEVITEAGTIGLAPEINPNTGLPHHPPS